MCGKVDLWFAHMHFFGCALPPTGKKKLQYIFSSWQLLFRKTTLDTEIVGRIIPNFPWKGTLVGMKILAQKRSKYYQTDIEGYLDTSHHGIFFRITSHLYSKGSCFNEWTSLCHSALTSLSHVDLYLEYFKHIPGGVNLQVRGCESQVKCE